MDKFPLGVLMNKGMTLRTAQQHGQKYVPACSSTSNEASSTPRS
jgi:hypothetical protein